MRVTIPGTYTLNDNLIKFNLNKEEADMEIGVDMPGSDDATKNLMNTMLQAEFSKQKKSMIDGILAGFPLKDELKIVNLTEGTLSLESAGEVLEFTAVPD